MIMIKIHEFGCDSSGSGERIISLLKWQISNVHETGAAAAMEIKNGCVH